jgi:2-iminobutanoate/2-iminopropanoate deaminase
MVRPSLRLSTPSGLASFGGQAGRLLLSLPKGHHERSQHSLKSARPELVEGCEWISCRKALFMKKHSLATLSLTLVTLSIHADQSQGTLMATKKAIRSIIAENAPAAIGPYSHAVEIPANSKLLFISGQVPLNPATNTLVTDLQGATHQVMNNLKAILNKAGYDFKDVVKSTIFLTNMDDFQQVNAIYGSYFTDKSRLPARATVQVSKLPRGVQVEIEMLAAQVSE